MTARSLHRTQCSSVSFLVHSNRCLRLKQQAPHRRHYRSQTRRLEAARRAPALTPRIKGLLRTHAVVTEAPDHYVMTVVLRVQHEALQQPQRRTSSGSWTSGGGTGEPGCCYVFTVWLIPFGGSSEEGCGDAPSTSGLMWYCVAPPPPPQTLPLSLPENRCVTAGGAAAPTPSWRSGENSWSSSRGEPQETWRLESTSMKFCMHIGEGCDLRDLRQVCLELTQRPLSPLSSNEAHEGRRMRDRVSEDVLEDTALFPWTVEASSTFSHVK